MSWEPPLLLRGQVRCEVRDNGVAAVGQIRVDAGTWVECNRGLVLPPGFHALEVRLKEAAHVVEEQRWVRLAAGERQTLEVGFETGELHIAVRQDDRPMKSRSQLWSRGEVRAHLGGFRPARVQIGTYVVDVQCSGQGRRFEAVHVSPNTRTVLVWELSH